VDWTCRICGVVHDDLPTCFGVEAPWRFFVPEAQFDKRVDLTKDQCVIDEKHFFQRGHVIIPIIDHQEGLAFSVWTSLSEKSFLRICDRWTDADRVNDPPYFGWLSSQIPVYENTENLPLSVTQREPGLVPLFRVTQDDHPLAIDQRNGITIDRWHAIVHSLLDD